VDVATTGWFYRWHHLSYADLTPAVEQSRQQIQILQDHNQHVTHGVDPPREVLESLSRLAVGRLA
jgi:hypothetical protein